MKKLLFLAAALCCAFTAQAQNEIMTAILQHGEDATAFTGMNALVQAHETGRLRQRRAQGAREIAYNTLIAMRVPRDGTYMENAKPDISTDVRLLILYSVLSRERSLPSRLQPQLA